MGSLALQFVFLRDSLGKVYLPEVITDFNEMCLSMNKWLIQVKKHINAEQGGTPISKDDIDEITNPEWAKQKEKFREGI